MTSSASHSHPALAPGSTAVVTGAASGIGLAAAARFASFGMRVVMADLEGPTLNAEAERLAATFKTRVIAVLTDVSRRDEVERLHHRVVQEFGGADVVMNNAGRDGGGEMFGDPRRWADILATNLWGVIHGCQIFGPAMAARGKPGFIINTGSKQGITTPPGDTAYNVSKAGVKVVTEALAHALRNKPGCRLSAHLLIPGFTFTGLTKDRMQGKPPSAWEPHQVVDAMVAGLARGDFYILCPDNEVTRELDEKRILWAANDVVKNRPALSRWHPDYQQAFADFVKD